MGNYFQKTIPAEQIQPISVSVPVPCPIDVCESPVLPIVCITPTSTSVKKSDSVSSIRSRKSFTFDEVVSSTKKRKYCDAIEDSIPNQPEYSSIPPHTIEHVSASTVPQVITDPHEEDSVLYKKMTHLTL